MKYELNAGETQTDLLNVAHREAYNNLGISIIDILNGAKDWNNVRQEVSKIMIKKLKGRSQPLGKSKGIIPSREGYRLNHDNLLSGFYPNKFKTPNQKLQHLKTQKDNTNITQDMYIDFGLVLGFKLKRLMKDE